MKYFLAFALMACGYYSRAQTDSVEIKLQYYNRLFIKNLITANEYVALKAKLLGIEAPGATEKPRTTEQIAAQLKKTARADLAFGGFWMGVGSFALISDFIAHSTDDGHYKTSASTILSVVSAVTIPVGSILVAFGSFNMHKANRLKSEMTLKFSGSGFRLGYAF